LKKFLILGGNGFIGRHLAAHFRLVCPEAEVETLSLPVIDLEDPGCRKELLSHYDGNTVLILLAATKRQYGDSLESFRRNLAIVENVGLALVEQKPLRLLFFSSAAVYGEETNDLALREASAICPQTFYGLSKFNGERMLGMMLKDWATQAMLCLRPPLVYGPGDAGRTYGPSGFCIAALGGEKIQMWGDGTELREFLFIEDLCRVVVALLERGATGVINLAFGQSHSFKEVIYRIEAILGQSLSPVILRRTKIKADNRFDPTYLRSLLSASIQPTPLDQGLRRILEARV